MTDADDRKYKQAYVQWTDFPWDGTLSPQDLRTENQCILLNY